MIDKGKIVQVLVDNVSGEIESLVSSYEQAHSDACGDEMKSDGKYDTRAVEAGYLVGAQKKRIEELKLEQKMLEAIEVRSFSENDEIAIGALVEIKLNNLSKNYFLSPTAGGTLLNIDGNPILVISVFSPIGSEALGLTVGDSFELETSGGERCYTVEKIW